MVPGVAAGSDICFVLVGHVDGDVNDRYKLKGFRNYISEQGAH